MSLLSKRFLLPLLGILFLAFNLRGPFTSLAPVLDQIITALPLNTTQAGLLTALPLVAFALISPWVSPFSRLIGIERSLIFALISIFIGIALRSVGEIYTLFIGTALIGVGIAIGNVLLPVVVKINFPQRIAMITALYTFTMGIGSTLSASLMVPLSTLSFHTITGWQLALLFNLLLPAIALIIWLPKLTKKTGQTEKKDQTSTSQYSISALLKSPVAWQVTFALGLNSFTFYSFAGWLPKILSDLHFNEIDAGYIYGLLQFSTMLPGLLLLPILAKKNNPRTLITACSFTVFLSLCGLITFPKWAIIWAVLFGLSNCATFIIALSLIGLRTKNSLQAAALSSMSQSIGYALAATGPTLIGSLYSYSHSWTEPLMVIALAALACMLSATLAARDKTI